MQGGDVARGSTGKYVGMGLLGAAVGAIAGVLFAPRSGKETRKAIGRGVKKAEKATLRGIKNTEKKAVRGVKSASRKLSWKKNR